MQLLDGLEKYILYELHVPVNDSLVFESKISTDVNLKLMAKQMSDTSLLFIGLRKGYKMFNGNLQCSSDIPEAGDI
jgi:hypothetical protein